MKARSREIHNPSVPTVAPGHNFRRNHKDGDPHKIPLDCAPSYPVNPPTHSSRQRLFASNLP